LQVKFDKQFKGGIMQAIRIHEKGGPEVMKYEETPTPQPGPGEVLLKVAAAGVNFIDIYYRVGQYPVQLPYTPGEEASGTVEAVGPGVSEFKPGDRVAHCQKTGSYAQFQVVPASKLVPVPPGVDDKQAAAVLLQGITAHYLSHSTYPIQAGDTVLIHAGAGGVGQLLIQMAKMRGATVITTVSNTQKAALAREAGADHVINYTETDFEDEVKRLTGEKKLPVVYDSVGKTTFDKSLNCLHPRGYMVLFGASSGPVPPFDPQILNRKGSLYLTRPTMGHYIATREELLERTGAIFKWIAEGKLKVQFDHTYPLAEAAQAHRDLQARATTGKVLLIP
jgi:NADPH2:quinone reductase